MATFSCLLTLILQIVVELRPRYPHGSRERLHQHESTYLHLWVVMLAAGAFEKRNNTQLSKVHFSCEYVLGVKLGPAFLSMRSIKPRRYTADNH